MNEKDIYNFFKESYEFEHERKDVLNSRLSFVLTSVIVIVGAGAYLINNMEFMPINTFKVIFLVFLFIFIIPVTFAFYYLYKCLFWFKYRYIASPALIYKYIEDLKEYNEKSKHNLDIGIKIEKLLKHQYSQAASKNRSNNKIKNGYFVRSLISTSIAGIVVILLAVPYYVTKATKSKETILVNVKNLSEVSLMLDDENKETHETPKEPEIEPELVEPTPPPMEDITEADVTESDTETRDIEEDK